MQPTTGNDLEAHSFLTRSTACTVLQCAYVAHGVRVGSILICQPFTIDYDHDL